MNYNLILPLIIVVAMLWFMSRQQKKMKNQQQTMQNSLAKGAEVVTIGGLHAVVDNVNKEAKTVDLDAEGVILTFELSAIRTIKPTAATTTDNQENKTSVEDLKPTDTKITSDDQKDQDK